jgi:hypothetical protein
LSCRDIVRVAGRRLGVDEEYIWIWDEGMRKGKGRVSSPRLIARQNVKGGQEIKGVEHRMLSDEASMSPEDARGAPRGFVTYNEDGSIEVATYGTPFEVMLHTDERAYNAVQKAFGLLPGGYKQVVLPMQRGSWEAIMELSKERTGDADDMPEKEGQKEIPQELLLTPQEMEEVARQLADDAMEGMGGNAVQTMTENPEATTALMAEDPENIEWFLERLLWDMMKKQGVYLELDYEPVTRQILLDLEAGFDRLFPDSPGTDMSMVIWNLRQSLKKARDEHERKHGFAKLNRSQQRMLSSDWDATIKEVAGKLMAALKEWGQDGEKVYSTWIVRNVSTLCDQLQPYLDEYKGDTFMRSGAFRKYDAIWQLCRDDWTLEPALREIEKRLRGRACELIKMWAEGQPWPEEDPHGGHDE